MRTLITALLSATLAAACARADSYSFKEPISQSGSFSPTGTVAVHNVNGEIEVRTWDKNEIKIEGEKSARSEEELQLIQLTIDRTPDRAYIEVKLPRRKSGWFGGGEIRANVRFLITVPASAHLEDIHTVNGGVRITGARGGAVASSVNGGVRAYDVTGSVSLTTVNGGVDARVIAVASGATIKARSVNGGVTLSLPADTSGTLDASTVNGGVDCDFPVTVSGKLNGRHVRGTIGGSGASEISASTVNGGVHIRKS